MLWDPDMDNSDYYVCTIDPIPQGIIDSLQGSNNYFSSKTGEEFNGTNSSSSTSMMYRKHKVNGQLHGDVVLVRKHQRSRTGSTSSRTTKRASRTQRQKLSFSVQQQEQENFASASTDADQDQQPLPLPSRSRRAHLHDEPSSSARGFSLAETKRSARLRSTDEEDDVDLLRLQQSVEQLEGGRRRTPGLDEEEDDEDLLESLQRIDDEDDPLARNQNFYYMRNSKSRTTGAGRSSARGTSSSRRGSRIPHRTRAFLDERQLGSDRLEGNDVDTTDRSTTSEDYETFMSAVEGLSGEEKRQGASAGGFLMS
ncbi:unnamed protein product [Amoebophrya sp. A25]|nr:unnamed protein product [Amoebophrya sp. A25]|eukprot:GSA25T00017820001.1